MNDFDPFAPPAPVDDGDPGPPEPPRQTASYLADSSGRPATWQKPPAQAPRPFYAPPANLSPEITAAPGELVCGNCKRAAAYVDSRNPAHPYCGYCGRNIR